MRLDTHERTYALLGALATLALLGVAAWLNPSPDGHGTHTQLGLAACLWAQDLQIPCPTCGMTTSFAWAAQGRWILAGQTQPFGLLLVLATMISFWACAHSASTGSRASVLWLRWLTRPRVVYPSVAIFLGAWAYKSAIWLDWL